ncbi:hypothetical protein SK128_011975, partial [Halocaridina rubra]
AARVTYHVYNLLESDTKSDHDWLAFVGDRTLQRIVVVQQVVQKTTFILAASRLW